MGLFKRLPCRHNTWQMKKSEVYINKRLIEGKWHEVSRETRIFYVCDTCQSDYQRVVEGSFTFTQVQELFPKP